MTTLKLTNYKVLSTGAEGGHHYISTEIEYSGVTRQITVLFKEKKLLDKVEITVRGNLLDEVLQQSLILLDTEIIDRQ